MYIVGKFAAAEPVINSFRRGILVVLSVKVLSSNVTVVVKIFGAGRVAGAVRFLVVERQLEVEILLVAGFEVFVGRVVKEKAVVVIAFAVFYAFELHLTWRFVFRFFEFNGCPNRVKAPT